MQNEEKDVVRLPVYWHDSIDYRMNRYKENCVYPARNARTFCSFVTCYTYTIIGYCIEKSFTYILLYTLLSRKSRRVLF